MQKRIYPYLFLLAIVSMPVKPVLSQNVGIGTTTPHNSAILDIQSTGKGVGFPSMSTVQRNAIPNPKPGLVVFDIDKNTLYMYDGGQWLALLFTGSDAQVPPVTRKASDASPGDQFGWSVAIDGNYAVIGAPGDNVGINTDQGCAYVFFREGSVWTEQAKLLASDGGAGDQFGWSVAINSNYIIVGAYLDNTTAVDAGSAYVFIRSGTVWTEQAKLVAGNPSADDHFGYSVSISGSYAAIGARDDDIGSDIDEGSAYVFVRSGTTWSQQDNVIAPFGDDGDHFGCSIGISSAYMVVGADKTDKPGEDSAGSVHVFFRNGGVDWTYQDELEPPFGFNEGNEFGTCVAIDGNYIVVGAPHVSSYVGSAAYVYLRNGSAWEYQAVLFANPVQAINSGNKFGMSVSIDGDRILVGCTEANINGNIQQGAAYLFSRDGTNWIYERRIENPGGSVDDLMAASVAVAGNNCIVGVSGANALRGKIYFLNLE